MNKKGSVHSNSNNSSNNNHRRNQHTKSTHTAGGHNHNHTRASNSKSGHPVKDENFNDKAQFNGQKQKLPHGSSKVTKSYEHHHDNHKKGLHNSTLKNGINMNVHTHADPMMRRSYDTVLMSSVSSHDNNVHNNGNNNGNDNSNNKYNDNGRNGHKTYLVKKNKAVYKHNDNDSNNNNNGGGGGDDNDGENSGNDNGNNGEKSNPFLMMITEEDEQICMSRAEAAMNIHRNLKVEVLDDLVDIYKAFDDQLVEHAQEYLRSLPQQIEANKQQATLDWLKGRSEKEKEQYLSRHNI